MSTCKLIWVRTSSPRVKPYYPRIACVGTIFSVNVVEWSINWSFFLLHLIRAWTSCSWLVSSASSEKAFLSEIYSYHQILCPNWIFAWREWFVGIGIEMPYLRMSIFLARGLGIAPDDNVRCNFWQAGNPVSYEHYRLDSLLLFVGPNTRGFPPVLYAVEIESFRTPV